MAKNITSIIDELRDLVNDLEQVGSIPELEESDPTLDPSFRGVIECLLLGLPAIEEKYGSNSGEADAVREILAVHG